MSRASTALHRVESLTLPEIGVELSGESEAGGDSRHDDGNEVVEISVGRGRQLQGPEANIVEGLVIDTERLVRVLNELVHGKSSVVRLNDGVGNL